MAHSLCLPRIFWFEVGYKNHLHDPRGADRKEFFSSYKFSCFSFFQMKSEGGHKINIRSLVTYFKFIIVFRKISSLTRSSLKNICYTKTS